MTRPLSRFVTATAGSQLVVAGAAEPLVDIERRTISGLVVPHGPAGHTSGGRLTFSAGSLGVTRPGRVKLLREHDQADSVGVGASFEDIDADEVDRRMAAAGLEPLGTPGTWATFNVPEGDNGDRALAEAKNGLRDAFSVGVQLDDATLTRLRRSQGAPIAAAGALREVSLVSVPAFDDARVAAAAGADLIVSAWTPTTTAPTTTAGAAGTNQEDRMTPEQIARLAALRAQQQLTQEEAAELGQLAAAEQPAAPAAPEQPATASTGLVTASGPVVVPAVAGAAHVTSEPATYTFSDGSPSVVVDLWNAHMRGDGEARQRVERFNAELADGNAASVASFVSAAATRDNVDGAGTDLPSMFQPAPNRPELMRALVDVKRPFISRLDRVPISNAQPFAIPKVGEFSGVGPHTEGTPHRAAGTLTLSGDVVQPTATSGAWEVSRELIDAASPALDRIAARAMLRDYQRNSEGKLISLLAARAAQDGSTVYGVDGVVALRKAMAEFVNDDEEAADIAALSKGLLAQYLAELDATDRPQLPFVGPVNAVGTTRAGYTGVAVDGVELFRAARLDAGLGNLGGDAGVLARSEGILWCESSVLQFRFDEVLGPGVVKLALWAYNGAAILDTADVLIVRSGVDA